MSLFWKIFVAFMIAMTVTTVGAVYVSFQLASQALEQVNVEGRDRIIEEVAAALAHGGERELRVGALLAVRERHVQTLLPGDVTHLDVEPAVDRPGEIEQDPASLLAGFGELVSFHCGWPPAIG